MQIRATFVAYLCINRSGTKCTPSILEGMPILGNHVVHFCQNKRTYSILMRQAFLLTQCLLVGSNQQVGSSWKLKQCCSFLHSFVLPLRDKCKKNTFRNWQVCQHFWCNKDNKFVPYLHYSRIIMISILQINWIINEQVRNLSERCI